MVVPEGKEPPLRRCLPLNGRLPLTQQFTVLALHSIQCIWQLLTRDPLRATHYVYTAMEKPQILLSGTLPCVRHMFIIRGDHGRTIWEAPWSWRIEESGWGWVAKAKERTETEQTRKPLLHVNDTLQCGKALLHIFILHFSRVKASPYMGI